MKIVQPKTTYQSTEYLAINLTKAKRYAHSPWWNACCKDVAWQERRWENNAFLVVRNLPRVICECLCRTQITGSRRKGREESRTNKLGVLEERAVGWFSRFSANTRDRKTSMRLSSHRRNLCNGRSRKKEYWLTRNYFIYIRIAIKLLFPPSANR